jgi:4-hydroxybenzoate polyprenyltransferase
MLLTVNPTTERWHALLSLGRISNLPTVWSNCIAGWVLGGGGRVTDVLLLILGASCLYLGGMFLNDAFDADFDHLHRRERPIPSGRISLASVWRWGFGWLGIGTVLLVLLGNATGAFAALLLFSIVLYDAVHKLVASAPLLMAACRFLLVLTAASVGEQGATGLAIWAALALGFYVTGLSTLARHENSRSGLPRWPALLLATPMVLALLANASQHRLLVALQVFLVGLWLLRCLQPAMMAKEINVRRSIEGLLAGIVLVDLLSLGSAAGWELSLLFLALFLLTLLLQRWFPGS